MDYTAGTLDGLDQDVLESLGFLDGTRRRKTIWGYPMDLRRNRSAHQVVGRQNTSAFQETEVHSVGSTRSSELKQWFRFKVRTVAWILVAGLAGYLTFISRKQALPQQAFASWGPQLDGMDTLSSFDIPAGIMDLKVAADGDVYALGGASLSHYTNGKLIKSVAFGPGPNRSMAFDGKYFYITNSDNNIILKMDRNLVVEGYLTVKGSQRLLGIVWLQRSSKIAVAEVSGMKLWLLNPDGSGQRHWDGPVSTKIAPDFAYNLGVDTEGAIYEEDLYSMTTRVIASGGKTVGVLHSPCDDTLNRRQALLGADIYTDCPAKNVICVRDLKGRALGYVESFLHPEAITTGADGLLYFVSGGKIFKVKPLPMPKTLVRIPAR